MRSLDLTNQTFGLLTAQSSETKDRKRGWNCLCSCGSTKWIPTFQLTSGNNTTCGDTLHKQSIKIGDRFGQLTVQRIYRDAKNRRYMAECLCDCGQVKPNASFKNLQRKATTHCGCSLDNSNKGLPLGKACKRALISVYKSNAERKHLTFGLTDAQCTALFAGDCYFCGQSPSEIFTKPKLKGNFTYSGIDRIDSSKGYVFDNVVSCCTACNYLKGSRTNLNFLNHIQRIAKHHGHFKAGSSAGTQ